MLIPSSLSAQNSICGVAFGTSFSDTQTILEKKFGENLYKDMGINNKLLFEKTSYAGFIWDYISLEFQENNDESYLNGGMLLISSETPKDAEENRDKIKELMERKYDIEEVFNEKNDPINKFYVGGFDPTNPDYCGFVIQILENKSKELKGKYHTILKYGPFDYIDSPESFVQDSICGVSFGTNYNDTKTILEKQFGPNMSNSSKQDEIVYFDKKYAGIIWEILLFNFQRDGQNSYLNEVIFSLSSKTLKEAEKKRDDIKIKMEKNYEIKEFITGDDRQKVYKGVLPATNQEYCSFTIEVLKNSKDNYVTIMSFGPYNFIKKVEEF